jgi:hypothetical protein
MIERIFLTKQKMREPRDGLPLFSVSRIFTTDYRSASVSEEGRPPTQNCAPPQEEEEQPEETKPELT